MAISTPKYTPVKNYAAGFLLSIFLLFIDLNYGTFSQLRGFFQASTLYVQLISSSLIENIDDSFSYIKESNTVLSERRDLKEQILQIKTKDFLEKNIIAEQIKIINLNKELVSTFKSNDINLYKIASIDLRNYLCCSTHKLFLHNNKRIQIKKNLPVLAGQSFVGQTLKTNLSFIEVILFSDVNHVLPIKSDFFYCDARGKGRPLLIGCILNNNNDISDDQVGDTVYTSGLGGIFMKDIAIGTISSIKLISSEETEVTITLKTNPLEENFYGIMRKHDNEV